jgi:hypothetical protein
MVNEELAAATALVEHLFYLPVQRQVAGDSAHIGQALPPVKDCRAFLHLFASAATDRSKA